MKNMRKLFGVLLAVALVFSIAGPAFAVPPSVASYTQVPLDEAPSASGVFTVYLSICSNRVNGDDNYIHRYDLPVSMGASGVTDTYYVTDVLVAADSQYNWLTIYSRIDTVITGDSTYVYGVKDTDVSPTVFSPVTSYDYYNGWMVRIDDKYPLLNSANYPAGWTYAVNGPLGATIDQMYVTGGEHISLYFADTLNLARATEYTVVDSAFYDATYDELTMDIYGSYSYYRSGDYYWIINDFYGLDTVDVTIKVDGNTYPATTDEDGEVTFNDVILSSGTYEVELLPNFTPHTYGGIAYGIPTVSGTAYSLTVGP
jgi:hypothetical protein